MSHPARKIIQKPFRGSLVEPTHPLVDGMLGCWVFTELTGNRIFDCSGNKNDLLYVPDSGSAGGWRSTDSGAMRIDDLSAGSGDYIESTYNNGIKGNTFSNGLTLYVRGRGVGETISLCGIQNGINAPFEFFIDDGDRMLFRLWSSSSNIDLLPTGLSTDSTVFYSYFCLYNPSVEMQLYRDEVLLGNRTSGVPSSLDALPNSDPLWFGTRADGGSPTNPLSQYNYNGWFSNIMLWERCLSDAERLQIAYNPYQMF